MPGADSRTVGSVQLDIVRAGTGRVKRAIYPAGFRWSTHMKPVTGTDTCQHAHVGFLARGRIHVHFPDGCVQEYEAPAALVIEPGHDAWVIGDQPAVVIEFDFEGETVARFGVPRVASPFLTCDCVSHRVSRGLERFAIRRRAELQLRLEAALKSRPTSRTWSVVALRSRAPQLQTALALAAAIVVAVTPATAQRGSIGDAVRQFVSVDAPVIALTNARVIDGTGGPARRADHRRADGASRRSGDRRPPAPPGARSSTSPARPSSPAS